MTSTVLDAAVCLLMVSGAVLAVTGAGAPSAPGVDRADATAETLATATASVNYTLAPGARRARDTGVAFPRTSGPAFERTDHGSLAGLLAEAAVGSPTVDGTPLTHTHDDFASAVRAAVRSEVGGDVQVVAVWRPYPDASVGGRVAVGSRPPPGATVHAATLSLPSGVPPARADARDAAGGYDAVARVVAVRVVAGLFPPGPARLALGGDYPVSRLVRHRYRRAAAEFGADVDGPLRRDDPHAANARLVDAVAPVLAREMRRRFETPGAAADAVRTGTVRVVVRRWA